MMCLVSKCSRPAKAKGLCNRHYEAKRQGRIHTIRTPAEVEADVEAQSKVCTTCEERKSFSDFHKASKQTDGLCASCKSCRRIRFKTTDNDKRRATQIATKYGLSKEEASVFVTRAKGACNICGDECPTGKQLAIDHDHSTGLVRGVLCVPCNMGLGYFKDDSKRLRAAAKYLED